MVYLVKNGEFEMVKKVRPIEKEGNTSAQKRVKSYMKP